MMDKAKAYDEALEKARQDRDAYQKELDKTDKNSQLASILKAGISALEMVFPQLKDSDNDRIRKCLHDIVNWFSFDSKFFTNNFVTKKDVIAYLEKQKGSLRDFIDDFPYSDKSKVDIDKLRRDLYQSGYNDGYQHGKEDTQKEQKSDWSEEDEKRVKQLIYDTEHIRAEYEKRKKELGESFNDELIKDCDEQIAWLKDISLNHKKFIEAVYKLWSNEWSEEDELMRTVVIQTLERFGRCGTTGMQIDWLKALRPQKLDASKLENFDPVDVLNRIKTEWPMAWEKVVGKQEWSEDDKQIIDLAVDAVEDFYNGGIRSKIINLLKSIRPSWKPNEEQMDALKNVAYGTYQNGDGPALRELYEQLLKLGVKKNEKI